jgi:hypothetical protein
MKKRIFTISAIVATICNIFAVKAVNETVLATYELPMGQEKITQTVWCETPPKSFVTFNGVVPNPVKDDKNNTNNCYMAQLADGYDWWGNFLDFRLSDPITITESNRYLHMLHYREKLGDTWMLCLNSDWPLADSDKGTLRFDGQNAQAGDWEDIVIDLKSLMDSGTPLSKFMFGISMDWSGPKDNPGASFYMDEVVLSDSPLPRGLNILPDTSMSLFYGITDSYNKWVKTIDVQNSENSYQIVTNPYVSDVLNSSKVLQFNKSANASWWQGLRTILPGAFVVGTNGESNYLHVMVNIPIMDSSQDYYVIQLNAKDFSGNQIDTGDNIKYWSTDAGTWVDCVLDVTSLGYVQEFTVRFDVRRDASDNYINSPAGTFYMDAVSIDNNPDQRIAVNSSVKSPKLNDVKAYSKNKTIYVEGNNISSVEIYNSVGDLIYKINSKQCKYVFPISHEGIYVIRSMENNGNSSINKLLVK